MGELRSKARRDPRAPRRLTLSLLLDADLLADDLRAQTLSTAARDTWDPKAIVAARAEADGLSAGRQLDEPAALFFALARRSRAFGGLAKRFIPDAARAQAIAIGYELTIEDLELAMLRAAVLRGEVRFEDLRQWFADALRPLIR